MHISSDVKLDERVARELKRDRREREEMGGGSVLNLAFKSPVPLARCLFLSSSFPRALSVPLLHPSALHPSSKRRSRRGVSLSRFDSGTTNIAAKWRPFVLARKRDSSVPRGVGEKWEAWKRNANGDGHNWRER